MSIMDDVEKTKKQAIHDAKGIYEDTEEAAQFVIDLLRSRARGEAHVFSKATIELGGNYIAKGNAIVGMMERWVTNKDELLEHIGEEDESMLKILPTLIMARTLQNLDKRSKK